MAAGPAAAGPVVHGSRLDRGALRRSLELLAPLSANKGIVLNAVMTQHLGYGAARLEVFDGYRGDGPEATVDDVAAPLA